MTAAEIDKQHSRFDLSVGRLGSAQSAVGETSSGGMPTAPERVQLGVVNSYRSRMLLASHRLTSTRIGP